MPNLPSMPPAPDAILFDLDDTILDFSSCVENCWSTDCADFAGELEPVTPDQLLEAISAYRQWYWSDAERHQRGRLDLRAARREVVAGALLQLGRDLPNLADRMAAAYI